MGLAIVGTSAPTAVTLTGYQELSATYLKSWSSTSGSPAWGTTRYSKKRGATATFNFNGTAVAWVGQTGPKRGIAKVYLDGVMTKVDLYGSSLSEQRIVYAANGLSAGAHKLVVWVKGKSGRPRVDIDGFVVLS